jgi:hypothetical protein
MKTHPSCEFLIYDGRVYYNNQPELSGAFSPQTLNIQPGHISLYEYNIDKLSGSNNFIYPYVTKDSAGAVFSTIGVTTYTNQFSYGDTITSSYPMSASISREYITTPSSSATGEFNRHFVALKNRLNFYGIRSQHYRVTSSYGDKNVQTLNLVSIPEIFFGSRIRPGTVSLKWYFTGSLIGELQDLKRNGELIQVGPAGSTGSGSVGGVILYDEGFVLLTGSWSLNGESIPMTADSTSGNSPSWIYWAAGADDGVNQTTTAANFVSASFGFDFKGQTNIQVLTMFAHAKRGEVNYSNNPTYLKYGQNRVNVSASNIYEENPTLDVANIVSSSYTDYSASYKRQVYISRVAIYDKSMNLIGIATLSNPILKEEDQDISFKIRLDI